MSPFWTALLTRLGVDPRGFAVLWRTFVLMDLRGQHYAAATATRPDYLISPLFWVVGQCLAISTGTSLVLFARTDVFFFVFANLSMSMLVMASTLLVEFHEVVLNPSDLNLLGHRPVSPRTYAAARFANLLFYVGLMVAALNLMPLLVGAGLRDAGPWYVPAYLLASLAGNLTVAALVIVLLSLGGTSGRLDSLKNILSWTQIVLLGVVVYGAQFAIRDNTKSLLVWGAFPPLWVEYLPPAWLAHFVEASRHPGTGTFAAGFIMAVVAVGTVALAVGRMARLYRFMQPAAVAGRVIRTPEGRVGQFGGALTRLLLRREEGVGFSLCRTLLARDTALVMRCLWPLHLAAAVVLFGLFSHQIVNPMLGVGAERFSLPILAVYLIAVAMPPILANLAYSRDYQASWLLFAAPVAAPAGFVRGTCKAVLMLLVAPYCAVFGLVLGYFWSDPVAALLHAVLAWVLAWAVTSLTLAFFLPALPFTLPPTRAGTMGTAAVPMVVCGSCLMLWAAAHCFLAWSPWFWVGSFALCLVAERAARRGADARLARLWSPA